MPTRPTGIRLRRAAMAAGAAAAIGAVRSLTGERSPRRDPCGPEGLRLPEGQRTTVTTDDGARLAVLGTGPVDGPAVVLAHGWTGRMELWGAVARRLVAEGCRVVLWDQRGHGDSTLGSAPMSVDRLGDDLRQLLEELGLRDVVLAGHSMGGMTVQALAARHPAALRQRVRGLTLVSTSATGRLRVPPRLADALVGDRRTAGYARREPRSMGRYAHRDSVRAAHQAFVATAGAARAGLLVAIGRMDYRPVLPTIGVPTRILVGSRDPLTPPVQARALAAAIPGADLRLLAGYGHMLPFEAPDVITEAVLSLTARPPVSTTAAVATDDDGQSDG